MHKLLVLAALLSAPALAATNPPNTLPKERTVDTAAHACQVQAADAAHVKWTTFAVANISTQAVEVVCGAPIDIGRPGTVAFGAWLNNLSGKTQTVTCVGEINTGDNAGAFKFTRSVMLSPNQQSRIEWDALDVNRATLDGGQGGFTCKLSPGLRLKWIYTVGVDN